MPRLPRWAWITVAAVVLVVVGVLVARAKIESYIAGRLEAQRAAVQAETEEIQRGIAAEKQALLADRQAAATERAAADVKKREAEARTAELRALLDRLARFDAARQQVREEASRVSDAELDGRIRAVLARLRPGTPGQGGGATLRP